MKGLIKLSFLTFFMAGAMMTSCQTEVESVQQTVKMKTGEKLTGNAYGEGISSQIYFGLEEVVSELSKKDEVAVTMRAKVEGVCQAKGCWMTLVDDSNAGEFMVKFQDYGFFVPKDISGKEVVVQGKAYREVTTVDELRHYAEDAKKSKEEIAQITEPKEELKFMATGVLVLN